MKFITLNQAAPWTDDFFFLQSGADETFVICNPSDSICLAPTFLRSIKRWTNISGWYSSGSLKRP